jgi:hypothetical protein
MAPGVQTVLLAHRVGVIGDDCHGGQHNRAAAILILWTTPKTPEH